jgi:hypothetical protein
MQAKLICFILLSCFILPPSLSAQRNKNNQPDCLLFNLGYGFQFPNGVLANRFGSMNAVSSGLELINKKTNLIIGINGQLLFGTNVKDTPLRGLLTNEGYIIGNDRNPADVQLRARGFYAGGLIGKLFALSSHNSRAGLRATFGLGFLQHKIRIQDDPTRKVAALAPEYKKGYDRLTNGFALQQVIGYQHMSQDRRLNYLIALECSEGFTASRRSFNFDTRMQDTAKRFDILIGIRAVWMLPFYLEKGETIEY